MYQLHIDTVMHHVYSGLPPAARATVARVLLDGLADPRQIGEPYGDVDDGLMRLYAADALAVVILIGNTTRRVTVLSLVWAGPSE